MRRRIALVLLAAWLVGCAAKHKIAYRLDDVTGPVGAPLSAYTVAVTPFEDARPDAQRGSRAPRWGGAVVTRDGDDWYVTTDDRYDSPAVAAAVTDAVVQHLRKAALFREVRTEPTGADLQLSGKLGSFEAHQDRQAVKEGLMAQGGLIFLAMGAATSSRYDATTRLTDLRLVDVASGRVIWNGDVEGSTSGERPLITKNQSQLYEEASRSLKTAVANLIERLHTVDPASTSEQGARTAGP